MDLKRTKESRSHLSLFNIGEIDCIMTLIRALVYKVEADNNELRSFPSRTLGSIRKYHQYKDFYVEVCVTPVIRSGYYEGCNLDWNVDYLLNGDVSYDSPDFYIDDIAYCGNLTKSAATKYAKLAEKKAEKLKNEIVEKLEAIYNDYSMKLGVTAQFSNGETIYHKVA